MKTWTVKTAEQLYITVTADYAVERKDGDLCLYNGDLPERTKDKLSVEDDIYVGVDELIAAYARGEWLAVKRGQVNG